MLVMDNLSAQGRCRARRPRQAGLSYRYLPAYSPDLNPMEPCWAKLKANAVQLDMRQA